MLEQRLTDAADGVKKALTDLVPPPVTDIAGAARTREPSPVAGGSLQWRGPLIAAGTAVAVLAIAAASVFLLVPDGNESVIQPTPTTTAAPIEDDRVVVTPTVEATWSLEGTVEGWLTEPVLVDGRYFAMRKGFPEGVAEGTILGVGDLWTSPDGVTWVPAEAGDQKPAAPADGATDEAAVEVRRNPAADQEVMRGARSLWATTDGETWREIALRASNDNWMPTVTAGGLGWVVYSPPMEATVSEFGGSAYQGPRDGNLGLWYTPDTEAWLEVTDLGPLADTIHEIGDVGVIDTTVIVRDNDILVYAYAAKNSGFGVMGNPHTEIWRLELSADTSSATQETVPSTTSPAVADDAPAVPEPPAAAEWNPILSTTKAKSAPTAATCPDGSNPYVLGPMDQARPRGASWSNQAAVFDQHAGRLVFLDEAGETWTFDVCTNTWRAMNPDFDSPGLFRDGWSGQLVYDVDSDLTISFLGDILAVYDADTNTWTSQPQPNAYETFGPGSGAVYDPVSGLVAVQTATAGLAAYDVETDTWTPIGGIEDKDWPSYLVGYLPDTDRFAFLNLDDDRGMAVDPRTGAATELEAPFDDLFAAFGRLDYATNTTAPYVVDPYALDGTICQLAPTTYEWNCLNLADGPGTFGPTGSGQLAASVGDPINGRVILIYGYGPGGDGQPYYDRNEIWAVDFDTGEWTRLLERTGEMTYE